MAEARVAVTEPRVPELEEGKDTTLDFIRAWRKAFFRRFFRTRNLIRNGMWPTSVWNLGATVSLFSVLLVGDWKWAQPINSRLWYLARLFRLHEGLPYGLRVVMVSSCGGIVFFVALMYKRRWLLRVMLSYRGWMYEQPKRMSWTTKVWGLIVRLVSGYHPTTYSYQKSLPYQPVPALDDTLNKFLQSIEPLHPKDSKEYQKFAELSQEFKKGIGPKMQRILVLKSWWAQNWVTDWWEKYIYLMGRTPISINSNYYILDHGYWQPTHRQISRAANLIYEYINIKRQIDREELPPLVLRGTIPLCMAQYEKCFSVTRIPGEDIDELQKFPRSKHVVVMRKGLYYKLDVFDVNNVQLSPQSLEKQLDWICEDADNHQGEYTSAMKSVSAMTATERTEWARTRSKYFLSGVNKDSLDVLESAIFHVILEEKAFKTWADRGKYTLHADGRTIWFDKSFNVIIYSDGKQGLNTEHSWGDAPVIGHVSEYALTKEIESRVLFQMYDEDGKCVAKPEIKNDGIKTPERLVWDIPSDLEAVIFRTIETNVKANNDLDLEVVDHLEYGKGFIKTCKVSPDAYVQLALQYAYYKDTGNFALTYEASMTRLYLLGRTETVRSLTNDAVTFIKAMEDPLSNNKERIELLRKACDTHQLLYRNAMAGKGIDRHLFGLYIACKGLGYENEFLKTALMMPWTLSTSQQPQQQIADTPDCSLPEYQDKVSPGGGFGPVSDQGYGVSYMLPGDKRLFFHVSSKKSCQKTDSARFVKLLFESLDDMKKLFPQSQKTKAN